MLHRLWGHQELRGQSMTSPPQTLEMKNTRNSDNKDSGRVWPCLVRMRGSGVLARRHCKTHGVNEPQRTLPSAPAQAAFCCQQVAHARSYPLRGGRGKGGEVTAHNSRLVDSQEMCYRKACNPAYFLLIGRTLSWVDRFPCNHRGDHLGI